MEQLYLLALLATQTSAFKFTHFKQLLLQNELQEPLEKQLHSLADAAIDRFISEQPLWEKNLELEYKKLMKMGAKIIYPGHEWYPSSFYFLEFPPTFLSLLGEPVWLDAKMISVVGSREPCRESLNWMDLHLSPIICEKKIVLVSGAARGIDQKAHEIALRNKLPTIAFLPSGLGNIYPPQFSTWVNEIISHRGAILSEYACHQEVRKNHFRLRNRMIAALSEKVLIVEAHARSGTLMTANLCTENSIPVGVVPGPPGNFRFLGNLHLLYNGAQMIRDQVDLRVWIDLNSRNRYF